MELKRLLIRKYALRDPVDWGQDCEDQLFLMNRLWNRLVEIEQESRTEFYAILARDSALQAAERELAEFSADLAAIDQRKADEQRIDELRYRGIALKRHVAVVRKEARERARSQIAAVERKRRAAVKLARQRSCLWWGNYN
jgi:hypothetical protein